MPSRRSPATDGREQQHALVDEVLRRLYDGLHSRTAALGLFKKMDLNGTGELRGAIEDGPGLDVTLVELRRRSLLRQFPDARWQLSPGKPQTFEASCRRYAFDFQPFALTFHSGPASLSWLRNGVACGNCGEITFS